ncbi:MAG TPA: hypothetical protein VKN99_11650 [Polyangia bacterium]|nr:hypothetical protein [Polyangia bacterium]
MALASHAVVGMRRHTRTISTVAVITLGGRLLLSPGAAAADEGAAPEAQQPTALSELESSARWSKAGGGVLLGVGTLGVVGMVGAATLSCKCDTSEEAAGACSRSCQAVPLLVMTVVVMGSFLSGGLLIRRGILKQQEADRLRASITIAPIILNEGSNLAAGVGAIGRF